ncbi:endoglucanase M (EGM) (Endo-1,4-beta-glucanase)(Cellulase M) [Treponema primitia ZAS-2]|uniref:Endoglucanase M (EGM) (Endo-1,4-beta-glucanase)(Cellulase M) n=1 Tax=Treponema primitia (strain ATCC BAA-887 / DSM 12427 / ZAS-2) TaxID=545694 RepID=F5YHF6_TREPZ|nr:M42 family peptidase [Treponema primitia]AEF87011.1 endoglucanase M (EGM) (Endo-1,4-beta-glucanase)(Cellulase M) [Treponema primitia ZAS-2]
MSIIALLRELCTLDGVSGMEAEVRDYIIKKAKPHAEELQVDPLGNVLVLRKGKKRPEKRVMLCAHMDEVGFIIKDISPEGLLKFSALGGIDRRVILGKRLKVGPKKLPGVLSIKAYHLVDKEEEKVSPKIDDLFIDIGAQSREEAEKLVSIGDICSFDSDFVEFGNGFVKAKAIDDRIGCAVMLRLIEEEPAVDTWFAFVTQEELGLRGSPGAAFAIHPEIALILESTTAADLPSVEGHRKSCSPGKGAVLPFMDNSAIYDHAMFDDLRRIAIEKGILWQYKTIVAGGTDAGSIQRSHEGVQVAVIAAAVRCIHSPICIAYAPDFEEILKLARAYLEYLGE